MLVQKYRDMYQVNCSRNCISLDSSPKFLHTARVRVQTGCIPCIFWLGWRGAGAGRGARGAAGRCVAQRHLSDRCPRPPGARRACPHRGPPAFAFSPPANAPVNTRSDGPHTPLHATRAFRTWCTRPVRRSR